MDLVTLDVAPNPGTPRDAAITAQAARVLARQIVERSRAVVVDEVQSGTLRLRLEIEPGIGKEGFRIADGAPGTPGEIVISGNDARGLLYGVGQLLRDARYDDGFTPGDWRGVEVPQMPVRGMYFATHFHNFYHEAPIAEVHRYVEELVLWGANALMVWFDMHHYKGLHEPAAKAMVARLRTLLAAAYDAGMDIGLLMLGNEAYADSPAEWRADGQPELGFYGVELCPNRPGAMELMLDWRAEMLAAFADLDISYLGIWPYDQGGCDCSQCRPWGANGYLKIAEPIARLAKRTFPNVKIILSTWVFDYDKSGEYEGMWRLLATQPDWVDLLICDAHGKFPAYPLEHGVPGRVKMLNFAEISMQKMFPWGGFGANPLPEFLQSVWNESRHLMSGGFPYSEGIFEDLNKAVELQFYWDAAKPAFDTVREYAAFEFSPDVADEVVEIVQILEATQQHHTNTELAGQLWHRDAPTLDTESQDAVLYSLPAVQEPEKLWQLVSAVSERISPTARDAWRWRIIELRAALELELHRSGGRATEKSDALFEALGAIYHADQADFSVATPSRKALRRLCRPQ